MDTWLTDRMKEALFSPCLDAAAHIGRRLDDRLVMGQSIDERTLTDDFVELFDSSAPQSAWGQIATQLRDNGLYLSTSVTKSTREPKTGADIGIIIDRSIHKDTQG